MSDWLNKTHQYAQIGNEAEGGEETPARKSRLRHYWQCGRIHLFYAFLLILVASISPHTLPSKAQREYYGDEPVRTELRLSTVPKTFELDLKYAMPPSPEVNEAWASLFPKEGGFFKHPKLAPQKSCIAVFHQLHCLDMIRQALYEARPDMIEQAHNGSNPANPESDHGTTHDHNHAHDMYHIGHCFDLIRQSIICKPDLTIEVGDPAVGGVTGFGTEHQCVNWQQLMDWMRDNE
ncbi:hypothetical protein CI238_09347 [Colletotrichum incanum]|uniref:Uncharacterized protein n=1 Tax=Colletotrichum incanum TaxID=1573173 RepID=A0A161Y6N4_COLIC|nr:hypothetical protein CI238_09347 [Colletotrichum incanum]OHW96907.1 hypothetical protein CSPAE12_04497 [Colletotrichum incanum]